MAEEDSGSKTELPTSKRLKDARKKGDVAKSPDIGITVGFLFALLLLWLTFNNIVASVSNLMEMSIASPGKGFDIAVRALGQEAIRVLVTVSLTIVIPLALFGMVVEFLVIGPVFTAEKFIPKISNLDPVTGLKRIFGPDNLVELIKSIVKTGILCVIGILVVRSLLGDIMSLAGARPEALLSGIWYLILHVLGWSSVCYLLLMFLDAAYQKYSFTKRMKMSIRDIRDEFKDTEGNPMLRGARRELGNEWASEAPVDLIRDANVLVVNPIHIAIAISYDKEKIPIPMITAKGEEALARAMRDIAARAGVPILRNEQLARALLSSTYDTNVGQDSYIPKELFNIVAEVIIWAQSVDTHKQDSIGGTRHGRKDQPPGEDLTVYDIASAQSLFPSTPRVPH